MIFIVYLDTAPEILNARVGEVHDKTVDIWSLGMIVYELLTLERPYSNLQSIAEISQRILRHELPYLPTLPNEYDILVQIMKQCLSADPQDRPNLQQIKKSLVKKFW